MIACDSWKTGRLTCWWQKDLKSEGLKWNDWFHSPIPRIEGWILLCCRLSSSYLIPFLSFCPDPKMATVLQSFFPIGQYGRTVLDEWEFYSNSMISGSSSAPFFCLLLCFFGHSSRDYIPWGRNSSSQAYGYQFLAFTLTDLLALIECYPWLHPLKEGRWSII